MGKLDQPTLSEESFAAARDESHEAAFAEHCAN